MSNLIKYIVGAIVAIVVVAALVLGVRWIFAAPTGATEAREQTVGDGSYRIAAYDRFFDDCAAALTTQQNLAAAQAQLDAADPADAGRLMQLQANVTALTAVLNGQVNQYNADARKEGTAGQFRASGLPASIDTTQEISCTV